MGAFEKLVDMLRINDDFDDEYEYVDNVQEKPVSIARNAEPDEPKEIKRDVRPVNPNKNRKMMNGNNMEVVRVEPVSVEDGRKITDYLRSGKVVFLDLEGIDINLAQRIIDFTSGATYAIDGTLQQMSKFTFVIAPAVVNVSGDFQDSPTGNSVTF